MISFWKTGSSIPPMNNPGSRRSLNFQNFGIKKTVHGAPSNLVTNQGRESILVEDLDDFVTA